MVVALLVPPPIAPPPRPSIWKKSLPPPRTPFLPSLQKHKSRHHHHIHLQWRDFPSPSQHQLRQSVTHSISPCFIQQRVYGLLSAAVDIFCNWAFGVVDCFRNSSPCVQEFCQFRDSRRAVTAREEVSNHDFPSIPEILSSAEQSGIMLDLRTLGPFFRVTARNFGNEELGTAQGFVKFWIEGRILHLDSIRMTRLALQSEKPVFGMALLLGAVAVRYGYDCKCTKAELLAINDSDIYHSKLVRYYSRMGFKTVFEVTGESLQDLSHMLVWGGVGTRMDANVLELLSKWSPAFRRRSLLPPSEAG